jgi:3-phenylpropionate/trans-cinnamate dioxygenase ferredoxin reductase component
MTAARHVVVVGASQAGSACATALRAFGLTDISRWWATSHIRPTVVRRYPKACWSAVNRKPAYFLPAADGLNLVRGIGAVGLDRHRNIVELSTGDGIRYDGLVVATGARARRLDQAPQREVTLRSLDDVRALQELLVGARDVAVAGGGILGMEVAASAVALGKSVTIVDLVRPLLDRLGPVLSDILLTAAVMLFQYIGAPALLFGFGRNVTYRGAEVGSVTTRNHWDRGCVLMVRRRLDR